jgi:hypothetical protein
MGSTISMNKTKPSEKYVIKDRENNEETYTDISYILNNTSEKPVSSKDKTQFICPNQHLNCKNERCWW